MAAEGRYFFIKVRRIQEGIRIFEGSVGDPDPDLVAGSGSESGTFPARSDLDQWHV